MEREIQRWTAKRKVELLLQLVRDEKKLVDACRFARRGFVTRKATRPFLYFHARWLSLSRMPSTQPGWIFH